jgi:hypothetical protein
MGEMRNSSKYWKKPIGRPRCRWEDNIGMDLSEIGRKDVD